MLKVEMPGEFLNLGGVRHRESSPHRCGAQIIINGKDEITIPNMGTFYRSPYNGRIRCKRVSKHPSIITDSNKAELTDISCHPDETVDFSRCDKSSTTSSSEGSDSHSDISSSNSSGNSYSNSSVNSSNSSGLRGILTKNRESKKEKKPGKRVKFHEQLENVRELKEVATKFHYIPHPLCVNARQNSNNKLTQRSAVNDNDLLIMKKQKHNLDYHSLIFSDVDNSSSANISRCSLNSSRSCGNGTNRSSRTVFKSPIRHSYKQQTSMKSDQCSSPRSDVRCYPGDVKLRVAKPVRPASAMSGYSPKILQNASGQKFVVCRYVVPKDDGSVSSYQSQPCENPIKLKHKGKPILPERVGICTTNFCNRDKASRIMRWLDSVDDVQTREGRYAELFDTVFHCERNA